MEESGVEMWYRDAHIIQMGCADETCARSNITELLPSDDEIPARMSSIPGNKAEIVIFDYVQQHGVVGACLCLNVASSCGSVGLFLVDTAQTPKEVQQSGLRAPSKCASDSKMSKLS